MLLMHLGHLSQLESNIHFLLADYQASDYKNLRPETIKNGTFILPLLLFYQVYNCVSLD